MTTSKDIKNYLKEQGFDTKKISVREGRGGYSTAFYITIKDLNIDKKKVWETTRKFESYERDERTGEILLGGNTYIFVQYDYDLEREAKENKNG